ncbi:hypothetical protein GCM10009756_17600 [Pseudokineococcus marinus]
MAPSPEPPSSEPPQALRAKTPAIAMAMARVVRVGTRMWFLLVGCGGRGALSTPAGADDKHPPGPRAATTGVSWVL